MLTGRCAVCQDCADEPDSPNIVRSNNFKNLKTPLKQFILFRGVLITVSIRFLPVYSAAGRYCPEAAIYPSAGC